MLIKIQYINTNQQRLYFKIEQSLFYWEIHINICNDINIYFKILGWAGLGENVLEIHFYMEMVFQEYYNIQSWAVVSNVKIEFKYSNITSTIQVFKYSTIPVS